MENFTEQKTTLGLYDPQFEHDACGIGAVVDIKGRKSHQTVDDALSIVERLEHRAGKDAEGKTGDGVGIMLQISHKFFSKVAEELNIRLGNEREYGVGMFFFPLVFLIPLLPIAWLSFLAMFTSYPAIQKFIINPFYEQQGLKNPELPDYDDDDEEVLFEDRGGEEAPMKIKKQDRGGKVIK